MILNSNNEKYILTLICLFFILAYIITYPEHAFYNDETSYLSLGDQILEGKYSEGILHRGPLLPSLISLSYLAGLDSFQIRFLLPLIFGILFLIATYLIGKRFCKNPFIPVLVVLSLAYFWRWAPFLLVDVLMGFFATLSILYFYKGLEDDEGYFRHSFIFLALAMTTKMTSAFLIIAFLVYLAFRKKLSVLKSGKFLTGVSIFLVIVLLASFITCLYSGSTGSEVKAEAGEFIRYNSFYLIKFAIIPWTYLFLYGVYRAVKTRGRDELFILFAFIVVFLIFNFISWKETRFLIFIFPLFAVLVERGLRDLRRNIKYILLAVFFIICFIESMLLLNTASYITWGSDLLAKELTGLESDSVIATDTVVLFDSSLKGRLREYPADFSAEWVEEEGIDYMVLSLYGEISRNPDMSYYKPKLGSIDMPLLGGEEPKMILTWWPDYKFNSALYQEASSNYEIFKKIRFEEQDVFIIYKTAG